MATKDVWAEALSESENQEQRNSGLWARCFAQADGDENKARAAYIRIRAEELEKADGVAPAEPPQKAKGWCPLCKTECSLDSTECPKCRASFATDSAYKPLGTKPIDAKPHVTTSNSRGWCPVCHAPIDLDSMYCSACSSSLTARHLSPLKYRPTNPAPNTLQSHTQDRQVIKAAKSRGVYIILALFLGLLGIHNFYAGRFLRGALQFIVTAALGWFVVGIAITFIWALIDMFTVTTDGAGDAMA